MLHQDSVRRLGNIYNGMCALQQTKYIHRFRGGWVEISNELMIYEWLVHRKKITYDIFFLQNRKSYFLKTGFKNIDIPENWKYLNMNGSLANTVDVNGVHGTTSPPARHQAAPRQRPPRTTEGSSVVEARAMVISIGP